jgi:hypothetical protein
MRHGLRKQGIGEEPGLVRDDAPPDAGGDQPRKHRFDTGERHRVRRHVRLVQREVTRHQRQHAGLIQLRETHADDGARATRNDRPHGLIRRRRDALLRAQQPQRVVEVQAAVEQRPVEVEEDPFGLERQLAHAGFLAAST